MRYQLDGCVWDGSGTPGEFLLLQFIRFAFYYDDCASGIGRSFEDYVIELGLCAFSAATDAQYDRQFLAL